MRFSLRTKVVLMLLFLEMLMVFTLGYFYKIRGAEVIREEFYERGRLLGNAVAQSAQLAVLSGNLEELNDLCEKTLKNPDTVSIKIMDSRKHPLLSCERAGDVQWHSVISVPIRLDQGAFIDPEGVYSISSGKSAELLGWIMLYLNTDRLSAKIRDLQWYVFIICNVVLCFSVMAGYFFMDLLVVDPILRLREITQRFASGDLDARISAHGNDEIAELCQAFNSMARSLKGYVHQQISSATDEIQVKNLAVMGGLSARLMHEVGNALNRIGVIRYQLSQELLSSSGQKALDNLESEMMSLKRFTRDVSLFSKRPDIKKSMFGLRPMVQGLVSSISLMDRKDVNIKIEMSGSKEIYIFADRELLSQALLNLLINAYDAVLPGGSIVVQVSTQGDRVLLQVIDNGTGIPVSLKEEIFSPFFTTKGPKGSGLGLAIAKSFVEAQGGRITCHSEEGKTVFCIDLPRGF